jgi:drug/metabolite transporter (DMT)-like permease
MRCSPSSHFWGFVGVLIFSFTLPATKLTVGFLDPLFVGIGRAGIAGALALMVLRVTKNSFLPPRTHLWPFVLTSLGVVVGFPMFSSLALQTVPANHSAVVLGILPLATAIAGAFLGKERHGLRFWVASLVGAALVVGFSVVRNHFSLSLGDCFLFLAVVSAAVGYAQGGALARTFGGWKVISWALVLALPVVFAVVLTTWPTSVVVPATVWAGFAYTGVFSMFLGFFAWYHGLAHGGIGKVGQWQLLQPFLTIGFSALVLGEVLEPVTVVVAVAVVAVIFWGRRPGKGA